MQDAAAADHTRLTPHNGAPSRTLSPEAIDAILGDFRGWLEAHGTAEPEPGERIDFGTLLAQFTALRHEVNLQTKASRALSERVTKASEAPNPILKLLLDVADVLQASLKQMGTIPETIEGLVTQVVEVEPPPNPPRPRAGLIGRLLGADALANDTWQAWRESIGRDAEQRDAFYRDAADKMLALASSTADGYAISLRRIEAALPDLGLVPIDCVGLPFDPETMEVVELGGDAAAGIVTAELRRGYHCNGALVRYAQVRVAR